MHAALATEGMLGRSTIPRAFLLTLVAACCALVGRAQTDIYRQQVIPQALFLYQSPAALDAKSYGSETITSDIRIERISFATQFGMRIPAIVYVPTHSTGKAPAMVVVAGHGGDKSSWYEVYTGLLYASAGAVVLTYDPMGEGERNPQRESETRLHDTPTGLQHPERVGGAMIEDAIQAMRYVESRPDVDPKRVALLGYSMGTFHAAIAAALHGPRALLLSGGGNLDGPDQYWDSSPKINCQAAVYKALLPLKDRGAMLYAHIGQTTSTFVMNGAQDGLITKFNAQEPWFEDLRHRILAIQPGVNLPETYFDPNAGHRPAFAERRAALWLNKQLHFPRWTDAQIEAFPLTTAHDWAKAHGVRIADQYDNTLQEGGVPILDLHLPGLTREQLTAVPLATWKKDEDLYVWDGWKTRALAAEAQAVQKTISR